MLTICFTACRLFLKLCCRRCEPLPIEHGRFSQQRLCEQQRAPGITGQQHPLREQSGRVQMDRLNQFSHTRAREKKRKRRDIRLRRPVSPPGPER